MSKKVKPKFINLRFELCEKREEKYMLQVEIEEVGEIIILRAATLSSFFEDQIREMAVREYSCKVHIRYKSAIPMDYYSFREFKRKVFGD